MNEINTKDLCQCIDCEGSEDACESDCGIDNMCLGCYEAHEETKEVWFEESRAMGWRF